MITAWRRPNEKRRAQKRRIERPFALGAALGTAAHHGFELASGLGLVWQPQIGLPGAATLWSVQILSWAGLAARGSRRTDPVLAAFSGASLAGVAVHYLLWPSQPGQCGLPVLIEAEGLSPWQMPSYNAMLHRVGRGGVRIPRCRGAEGIASLGVCWSRLAAGLRLVCTAPLLMGQRAGSDQPEMVEPRHLPDVDRERSLSPSSM